MQPDSDDIPVYNTLFFFPPQYFREKQQASKNVCRRIHKVEYSDSNVLSPGAQITCMKVGGTFC